MSWQDPEETEALRENLERQLAARRARGEKLEFFQVPAGHRLTRQFWGGAWALHLSSYCGYDKRLDRGRNYLRKGKVLNLTVEEGRIAAEVVGSYLYEVSVRIAPLQGENLETLRKECGGRIGSLLDLLSGTLGDDVMRLVTDPEHGLFPERNEIRHQCTCPDEADLCKHQAAVLYAVAVRFDEDPALFFRLRGVDPAGLISSPDTALAEAIGSSRDAELPPEEDLGALFGIELEPPPDVRTGSK